LLAKLLPSVESENESEWDVYDEAFKNIGRCKTIKVGRQYQVAREPNLIDSEPNTLQAISVWDSSKLSAAETGMTFFNKLVDQYLKEVRRLWPQHIYFYKEEIALMYLAFKSYKVDRALLSIYTD
jgi:hypothetical protein